MTSCSNGAAAFASVWADSGSLARAASLRSTAPTDQARDEGEGDADMQELDEVRRFHPRTAQPGLSPSVVRSRHRRVVLGLTITEEIGETTLLDPRRLRCPRIPSAAARPRRVGFGLSGFRWAGEPAHRAGLPIGVRGTSRATSDLEELALHHRRIVHPGEVVAEPDPDPVRVAGQELVLVLRD